MGLNFQGLGFTFAASDDGLLAYQQKVLSGFESINEQTAKMSKSGGMKPPGGGASPVEIPEPDPGLWVNFGKKAYKAMSGLRPPIRSVNTELFGMRDVMNKLGSILGQLRLGNLLEGLSLSNLNQITDAMDKLGGAGRNLTTSLEGEFASMGKQAKASFANLGYSAEEVRKLTGLASGMAKSLNLDVGATTDAIYAYGFATEEFAALGLNSAADIAKAVAVTGMNARETAQFLHTLTSTYGLGSEELAKLYSATVELGQASGDVGGAVGRLPALMEQLALSTDRYGNALEGADLARFAQETVSLSAGFYSMGYNVEQAEGASAAFAEAITKGRKDYAGLFMGVGDQIPEFLQQMSIATGGFEESFALMQQGPAGFTLGMQDMVDKVRASGGDVEKFVTVMGARLESTVGPDKAKMLKHFMLEADEGTRNVMKSAMNATTTLGDVQKAGFSTGRTLAESMQLAEDAFEMRFRKIGMASTRTFVRDAGRNFKSFGDQLQVLAAGDGPMAAIVTKFSEISSQGATAFLPDSLKPMAALMGNMLKTMGPALGIMGSLGFRLSMLTSPLTLLAAPLAVVALLFGDLVTKSWDAKEGTYDLESAFAQLGPRIMELVDKGKKYFGVFTAAIKKFGDWLIPQLPGMFRKAWAAVMPILDTAVLWFRNDLPVLLKQALGYGLQFGAWLKEIVAGIEWGGVSDDFFANFAGILDTGWEVFKSIATPLLTFVSDMLDSIDWASLGDTLGQWLGKAVGIAIAALSSLVDSSENRDPLAEAFKSLVSSAWEMVTGLAGGLWTGLRKEFSAPGAVAVVLATSLATPLRGIVLSAGKMAFTNMVWPLMTWLGGMFSASALGVWVTSAAASFAVALGNIARLGIQLAGKGMVLLAKSIPFMGPILEILFDFGTIAALFKSGDYFGGVKQILLDGLYGLIAVVPLIIDTLFGTSIAEGLKNAIGDIFEELGSILGENVAWLVSQVAGFFGGDRISLDQHRVLQERSSMERANVRLDRDAAIAARQAEENEQPSWRRPTGDTSTDTPAVSPSTVAAAGAQMSSPSSGYASAYTSSDASMSMSSDAAMSMSSEAPTPMVPPSPPTERSFEGPNPSRAMKKLKASAAQLAEVTAATAVVDGLPAAFTKAYADILPKTATFFDNYTDSFQEFVYGLNSIWDIGMNAMLESMANLVLSIQTDSASLSAEINRMTAALIAVQIQQEKTLSMKAAEVSAPMLSVEQLQGMEDLPESFKAVALAVHMPAWYDRYELLFARKMDELRLAVQSVSVQAAAAPPRPKGGGGGGAARQTIPGAR